MATEKRSGLTKTIWKTKKNELLGSELLQTDELDSKSRVAVTLRSAALSREIVRQRVGAKTRGR